LTTKNHDGASAVLENTETPTAIAPLAETKASGPPFSEMAISAFLKKRLATANFVSPTPVQAEAIPPALEGRDVLATAQTGTGKTLSFLIPMIDKLDGRDASDPAARKVTRALILLPTRELAMQVMEVYAKLVPTANRDSALVVGGMSEHNQLQQIHRGVRLIVATPGRLEDYLRRREVDLRNVEMLVLDEVDRMLDMGFLPSIRRIVGALPKKRQTLCYSATLDANVREVVRDYVREPVRIEIGHVTRPCDRVELRGYHVTSDEKYGLLEHLLETDEGSYLVFTRTKHGADRLSRKLEKNGHDVVVIHGDRSQSQRTSALSSFSLGNHRILVATDVAARGIDVSHIAHVVNYDMPNSTEDFVHRIGRTGRMERRGVGTTFVLPQERSDVRRMERELETTFEWRKIDGSVVREERNRPVEVHKVGNLDTLMQMEVRTWKQPGAAAAPTGTSNIGDNEGTPKHGGGGFSGRRGGRNGRPPTGARHRTGSRGR